VSWPKGKKRGVGQNGWNPLVVRFWARVRKSKGCWIWTGALMFFGYGKLRVNGKDISAHRLSWTWAHGRSIPAGMCVCHHCDTPACVRPDHLFLGTQADNHLDCEKKGRSAGGSLPGEFHPEAKLTWKKVAEIRRLYAIDRNPIKKGRGRYRQIDIAQMLKTSRSSVNQVVRGVAWR
jgi:hypothetical protein